MSKHRVPRPGLSGGATPSPFSPLPTPPSSNAHLGPSPSSENTACPASTPSTRLVFGTKSRPSLPHHHENLRRRHRRKCLNQRRRNQATSIHEDIVEGCQGDTVDEGSEGSGGLEEDKLCCEIDRGLINWWHVRAWVH